MSFIKSAIFLFILGTNCYSQTTKDSITVTLSSIDSINDRLTAIDNKLSDVLKKFPIPSASSTERIRKLEENLKKKVGEIVSLNAKITALEESNTSLSKKGTEDATKILNFETSTNDLKDINEINKETITKLNQYQLSNEQHIKYVKELLIRNLEEQKELDTSYLNSMLGFFKNDTSSTKLIKDINTYLLNQNSLVSIKKTMKLPEFKDFRKTKEAFEKIAIPTNFIGLTKRKIKESSDLDRIINIISSFAVFQKNNPSTASLTYRNYLLDKQVELFNLYQEIYTNYPCILFQFNKLQGDKSYVLPKTD
jgi:hypothetical protein